MSVAFLSVINCCASKQASVSWPVWTDVEIKVAQVLPKVALKVAVEAFAIE